MNPLQSAGDLRINKFTTGRDGIGSFFPNELNPSSEFAISFFIFFRHFVHLYAKNLSNRFGAYIFILPR